MDGRFYAALKLAKWFDLVQILPLDRLSIFIKKVHCFHRLSVLVWCCASVWLLRCLRYAVHAWVCTFPMVPIIPRVDCAIVATYGIVRNAPYSYVATCTHALGAFFVPSRRHGQVLRVLVCSQSPLIQFSMCSYRPLPFSPLRYWRPLAVCLFRSYHGEAEKVRVRPSVWFLPEKHLPLPLRWLYCISPPTSRQPPISQEDLYFWVFIQ